MYKVICYMRIEADLEDVCTYKTEEEADKAVENFRLMQPENRYEIEPLNSDEIDRIAREQIEQELYKDGIIDNPDEFGGLLDD